MNISILLLRLGNGDRVEIQCKSRALSGEDSCVCIVTLAVWSIAKRGKFNADDLLVWYLRRDDRNNKGSIDLAIVLFFFFQEKRNWDMFRAGMEVISVIEQDEERKGAQYEIWEAIKGRRGTASETKERRKEEEKEEEIFGCKHDDDGRGGGGIRDRGTGSPLPLRSSSFDSLQLATAIRPGCYRTPSLRSRHRSVAVLLFLRSHIHRILRYPHAWELPKHAYVQTTLRYHHVCTCVRDPSHLVSHLRILWGLIDPFAVADSSQRSFPLVFLGCKIWIWISISDTSEAGGISKLTRAICCRRMQLVSSFLGTGPRVWWQLNLTGCGAAMWCPWEGRNRIRQADIQSVRIVLLSLVCVVLKFLWRKWIQQGTSISVSV